MVWCRGKPNTNAQPGIKAALDAAALSNDAVYLPDGIFEVEKPVLISNGVNAFYGPGKLKFTGLSGYTGGVGVIDLQGAATGITATTHCRIAIAEIDAYSVARVCIFLSGGNSEVLVTGIVCKGIPQNQVAIQLNFSCFSNTIENNKIYLPVTARTGSTQGINIIGKSTTSGGSPVDDGFYFEDSGVPRLPTFPSYNNIVKNNFIFQGVHGIFISGGLRNLVTGNNCSDQSARSILVCNASFSNLIDSNICTFFTSSGIHLCYNSHQNTVSNNFVYSPGATGEGGLQAYVGCTDNIFESNYVNCGCNYGIYIAITASRNVVSNNSVSGYKKAGIAIESDWNLSASLPAGAKFSRPNSIYPSNPPATSNQWPFTNSDGNIITNNIIGSGYNSTVAAIYLASVIGAQSGQPVFSIGSTVIKDNLVTTDGLDYHCYIYEQTSGAISYVTMNNNNFQTNNAARFYFSSNRNHFFEIENNSCINNGIVTFPNAATTPTVSVGELFFCNNSAATSITYFTGGKVGQKIIVRLDVNTTLVYNNSYIKLKKRCKCHRRCR